MPIKTDVSCRTISLTNYSFSLVKKIMANIYGYPDREGVDIAMNVYIHKPTSVANIQIFISSEDDEALLSSTKEIFNIISDTTC